jgi:hypothetical protein
MSDAAHVTPGQTGEYVSRIQYALLRLLVSDLPEGETDRQFYGPQTAEAVLKYKRSLGIINTRYQTRADNIVGRMTIKSLDDNMWALEGGYGPPRRAALSLVHPQPPKATGAVRSSFASAPKLPSLATTGRASGFEGPLAVLPDDLQEAIRRSNSNKTPDDLRLYPFIRNDLGPQSDKDLSQGFLDWPDELGILASVYARMRRFDIFQTVKEIFNTYRGPGSKGFYCEPFNYTTLATWMSHWTWDPKASGPVRDSAFCRDAYNVHGERDCFREIVAVGPGLHICITQPAKRGVEHCDFHIDEDQQGQVCFDGWCVPIADARTAKHLWEVGPYLLQLPLKKIVDWNKDYRRPSEPLY